MAVKLEGMTLEYNYLLSGQLDHQRQFFERQLHAVEARFREPLREAEAGLMERLARQAELRARRTALAAELAANERVLSELEAEATRKEAEMRVLRDGNTVLMRRQQQMRARLEAARTAASQERERVQIEFDGSIRELEEQVQELNFHLNAQRTIQRTGAGQQLLGGRMYVPDMGPRSPQEEAKRGRGRG